MNCPYCDAKPYQMYGYECGTEFREYTERSTRCYKAEVLQLKDRITELSVERNELKDKVLRLQDLQQSIGRALTQFGKQLS